MTPRRFQVERQARWLGWFVRERGERRIAVFFRRSEAREYARWLNASKPDVPESVRRSAG